MGLGIAAFFFQSEWASYSLLFLLSMQSAFFSPPKYSIIPEIVSSPSKISKANGSLTSFTYLGIIFGTFLASFLTQITRRHFAITACACTLIAIIGFVSSLFLPYTEPKQCKQAMKPFFFSEIYRNLKQAKKIPYLFNVILGSSSFLFIGAYFQLNVIPYAIQTLKINEVGGGYLFLLTAVGIACGALLAGRLLRKRIEVGLSCFAGIMLALTFFFFSLITHLIPALIILFFIGVCGGLYIVPLNSYIQTYSPEKNRGQIVAVSNVLSFSGVLIAPILIYFLGEQLGLSAAQGFMGTSFLIFFIALSLTSSLFSYFFSYLSLLLIKLFYKVDMQYHLGNQKSFVLTAQKMHPLLLCLLSAHYPRLHLYIPRQKKQLWHLLIKLFPSVYMLHKKGEDWSQDLCNALGDQTKKGNTPCLLLSDPRLDHTFSKNLIRKIMQEGCGCKFVSMKKGERLRGRKNIRKRPALSLEFSDSQSIGN